MTDYRAPLKDMRFVLNDVVGMAEIASLPGYEEATDDLVDAVLEEAGKLASDVIGPLNQSGDQTGSKLENGAVRQPAGFKDAYHAFVEGGWNGLAFEPAYGGQGLPWTLNTAVVETFDAANTAWALCPMLTVGAIEALTAHGSADLQQRYLPKLVSGEWTGTMNLTEPQAGSDVGALRSKAVKDGDHYRITGQKIFITYGDQDYTDNVIHLVLARTEGAPDGVKGISLFLVPKFLVNADGSLGDRNDLRVASLEHKLGIHASPTCVMSYGDDGGAIGYLIGEEYDGMRCMFTMMNNARLNVGLLGLGTAERAYQQAVWYAQDRVQGKDIGGSAAAVPIIAHPDVRRMLMSMRSQTEAMRALLYYVSRLMDISRRHPDEAVRTAEKALLDFLIPITKSWCTDLGCEVAHTGVQVHGGMGFIEETGAAQHMRDARIHPIYEGTNGIQANDLMGRKLLRDGGESARALMARMQPAVADLGESTNADLKAIGQRLAQAFAATAQATDWMLATGPKDIHQAAAGAVPFLNLFSYTVGGWLMALSALAADRHLSAGSDDAGFYQAKIKTARFYADHELTKVAGLKETVMAGGESVMAIAADMF